MITVKPNRTESDTERRIIGDGLKMSILKPYSYGKTQEFELQK